MKKRAICNVFFLFQVCAVHFNQCDIQNEITHFDEKSGKLITVPLRYPRLKANAVPLMFPGSPSYFSSHKTSTRESPSKKRKRKEVQDIEHATAESLQSFETFNSLYKFTNWQECCKCLKNIYKLSSFWDLLIHENIILFLHLKTDSPPQIIYSVSIVILLYLFVLEKRN